MLLSIFLRVQPAYLPITDEWAGRSINQNIKNTIQAQLDVQYPNLPQENKDKTINEQFAKMTKTGKINIGGQEYDINKVKSENSKFLKQKFQNAAGNTYLLAIDPYYFYRHTRNAVKNGYEWDYQDENGRYHDTKILGGAPLGKGTDRKYISFHVFLQQIIFKFVRLFNHSADLMGVIFYTPVLIGTLAVIPAFFIARKVAGNTAGFFSGVLIAIHPAFLTRTAGGFSDTDAYNVLFPLIIVWFIMESFDAKNLKNTIIYAGLSGFSVGLFIYAWNGSWFIFDFVLLMLIATIFYKIIIHYNEFKKGNLLNFKSTKNEFISGIQNQIISGTCFFISSAIFVSLFTSFSKFLNFFTDPFKFTQIKAVGTTKVWPNVYTTVAELNPATLKATITQISLGSKIWLLFALLGLIIPMINLKDKKKWYYFSGSLVWYLIIISMSKNMTSHIIYSFLISLPLLAWVIYSIIKKTEIDIKYSLILGIWFAATIFASSKGVRFILLLVPAFAITSGITIGFISTWISKWISSELKVNKLLVQAVIFALFFSLLIFPTNFVKASYNTAINEVPSMNDDWYNTLNKINLESEPDAIINSWWDFGHWFAAIGNRSVTLDGGRQNNPAAHWLGKLMLTNSETESVGILRYLDCGSNTGFETLLSYMQNDSLKTVNIIHEIVKLDKNDAKKILEENGLNNEQSENVLQYTHCAPPEDYFITSDDMVGKSGVWAHFGAWNFTKAVMFNKVHDKTEIEGIKILKGYFGFNESTSKKLYEEITNANADQWIAPWPSYAGGSPCTLNNNELQCKNGVIFDFETEDAKIETSQGTKRPKVITYIKDGEFKVKKYDKDLLHLSSGRDVGVIIHETGGKYTAIISDYALADSIFTRLFYYENSDGGLKHFEKFNKVTDVTGAKIIVWKVNWEGITETTKDTKEDSHTKETSSDKDNGEDAATNNTEEKNIQITPETKEQTNAEPELVKVEHILISTENRNDEEALKLAQEVLNKTDTEDFSELIKQNSECSSATIPCNLGWFGRGVLLKEFEDAAFSLSLNEISEPVKTKYGYEIIKLVSTK